MKLTIRSTFQSFCIATLLAAAGTCSANSPGGENAALGKTNGKTEFPQFLVGEWLVTEVHVDRHIDGTGQPTPYGDPYRTFHNDPTLVGRVLGLSEHEFSWKYEAGTECRSPPTLQVDAYTIEELFKRSFGAPRSPDDFGLSMPGNGAQKVYRLKCEDKFLHRAVMYDLKPDSIDGAWILQLPGDKLALRWDGESILILEPFKPAEHANPSFNCALAKTVSEHAICESPELALSDLSVDTAYKQLLKAGDAAKIRLLNASQKGFLAKREECQRDKRCLKELMRTRVFDIQRLQSSEDLSEEWQDDIFLAPKSHR